MSSFAQSFEPNALLELHVACRQWSSHEPENLPYVDLMFAFGMASIGDRTRALELVEGAKKVLVVPVPVETWNLVENQKITAPIVSNFLFKAFKYRVDRALEGKPIECSLSAELLAEMDGIDEAGRRTVDNPFLRAEFTINRLRQSCRILEPQNLINPYQHWTKTIDEIGKELEALDEIQEADKLKERIRAMLQKYANSQDDSSTRVLTKSLSLSIRTDNTFRIELLEQVVTISNGWAGQPHCGPNEEIPGKARLLERAFCLAGQMGQCNIVAKLVNRFHEVICTLPSDATFNFINVVMTHCLRCLQKLGLSDNIGWLLTRIHQEILGFHSAAELRAKYIKKPLKWSAVLQTLLELAVGWFMIGGNEHAEPIIAEARSELLEVIDLKIEPHLYSSIAQSYVAALVEGPVQISQQRMLEFFRTADPIRISTTWTTREYYSLSHLKILEGIILGISRRTTKPHIVEG